MFGRDWKKGGYEEIDNYHPVRQAWEFLRRKPSYQEDCLLAQAVDVYLKGLNDAEWNLLYKKYRDHCLGGKVLAAGMIDSGGCDDSITSVIWKLSSVDAGGLFTDSVEWVRLRHNLESCWDHKCHAMPDEDIPNDLDSLFKFPDLGYKIEVAAAKEEMVVIQPGEAAIVVDLTKSIPQQIKGVIKQLKCVQQEIEAGGNHLYWNPLVKNPIRPGAKASADKRSKWEFDCVPPREEVEERVPAMKENALYIRVLDALADRAKKADKGGSLTYMDMLPFFDPKKNQEVSERYEKAVADGNKKDQKRFLPETKAKDHFSGLKSMAEQIMKENYTIIANNKPRTSLSYLTF